MDAGDIVLIVIVCCLFCVCITMFAIIGCICQQLCCVGLIALVHRIYDQMKVKYYGQDQGEFNDV
jgi:hypothetical protein